MLAVARAAELEPDPRDQSDDAREHQDQPDGRDVDEVDGVRDRVAEDRAEGGDEDRNSDGHNGIVPRFWITMQVVLVVCILISMVIAIVKL